MTLPDLIFKGLVFWGAFGVCGPFLAVSLLNQLEKWPFYQERCHTLRWILLFVAGPFAWIAALNRICQADLRRYRQRQEAQELVRSVKDSCGKGNLGDVSFQDGRLVERHLRTFVPRLLDKSKAYRWDMSLDGQVRMTVGDLAADEQVTSFICTRDTIIHQANLARSRRDWYDLARWRGGLTALNRRRTGFVQVRRENGQFVWETAGEGKGTCPACFQPVLECDCKTEILKDLERKYHGS